MATYTTGRTQDVNLNNPPNRLEYTQTAEIRQNAFGINIPIPFDSILFAVTLTRSNVSVPWLITAIQVILYKGNTEFKRGSWFIDENKNSWTYVPGVGTQILDGPYQPGFTGIHFLDNLTLEQGYPFIYGVTVSPSLTWYSPDGPIYYVESTFYIFRYVNPNSPEYIEKMYHETTLSIIQQVTSSATAPTTSRITTMPNNLPARNNPSIFVTATGDFFVSSVILLDYKIISDSKQYQVKIINPNFWLVLLGSGLSFRDNVVSLQINIEEMAAYCAIKLILTALLYGQINLKYLFQNCHHKFIIDLAASSFSEFTKFFKLPQYKNYETYFANCYDIFPGVKTVDNICRSEIIYTYPTEQQVVITTDRNFEFMIKQGQLMGDTIRFTYDIIDNKISVTSASYHLLRKNVESQWIINNTSVDAVFLCDAGFSITENNSETVKMIYYVPNWSLPVNVVVNILPDGSIRAEIIAYTQPFYTLAFELLFGPENIYKIDSSLISTNDGVNIYGITYKITDVCKYNNYSPDRCIDTLSTSTLDIIYPNFAIVLRGNGLTLEAKINSLGIDRDRLIEYASNKLIVSRILYGKFDIKYLLSSHNAKFINDLSTRSKLASVYNWFLERNSLNTHFTPFIKIKSGVGNVSIEKID